MTNRSTGSKLSALASVVIIVAFFLPWVRACSAELSGYDIATNSTGTVEEAWMYWLTLLAPIFCLVLFFFFKNSGKGDKKGEAAARLVAGLIGFLPLLNIWYNVQQKGGAMEVLYGGWITVLGYAGLILSSFLDLLSSASYHNTSRSTHPSIPPPGKRREQGGKGQGFSSSLSSHRRLSTPPAKRERIKPPVTRKEQRK